MSIEVEVGTAVADFATVITGLLDHLDYDTVALLTDRKQLDLVADLLTVQSRLSGALHTVLGQVDRAEAAMTAHGVPMVSWLAAELRYTRGQASAMVHHAADLHRFTQLGHALRDGRANDRQAQAVTKVLKKLPTNLGVEAEAKAQATMVIHRDEFDSYELGACRATCWIWWLPRWPRKRKRNGRNANYATPNKPGISTLPMTGMDPPPSKAARRARTRR